MNSKHILIVVGGLLLATLGGIWAQKTRTPGVLPEDETHFECTHDHTTDTVSDRESALKELSEIDRQLDQNPNDPNLISRKVHLGLAANPQAASDACRSVLRRDSDNRSAMGHLVVAYSRAGRQSNALKTAGDMLRLYPDAESHCIAAGVLAGMGKTQEARTHFETALKLDPSFESAKKGLARLSEL